MSKGKLTPWFTRRRTRSVGSTPFAWQTRQGCANSALSDEICSSSTSKDKDHSNIYQSDSDDLCSNYRGPVSSPFRDSNATPVTAAAAAAAAAAVSCAVGHVMESDSFNENSPCRRSTRRKRKYKKIAMDVDPAPINRFYFPCSSFSLSKKKRIMRLSSSNVQNGRLWLNPGKRKRSLREKSRLSLDGSCGGGSESSSASRDAKVLGISKLSLNDYPPAKWQEDHYDSMEVSYPIAALSSSSVSSSGSETGIFTNDEGREGDDEQSDWVGDVGLTPATVATIAGVFAAHNENDDDDDDDDGDQDDEDDETNYNIVGAVGKKATEESSLRGQLLSSRVSQFLCGSRPVNDCSNRPMRRKIRSLRAPLPIQVLRTNTVAEFPHHDSDLGNEMKVTSGRRHTFSSYKRRKRIPPSTMLLADGISEKMSQSFLGDNQRLSDISSSDSKESTL